LRWWGMLFEFFWVEEGEADGGISGIDGEDHDGDMEGR
jgi:hypothetical protein